jgi:hypothetical protein
MSDDHSRLSSTLTLGTVKLLKSLEFAIINL